MFFNLAQSCMSCKFSLSLSFLILLDFQELHFLDKYENHSWQKS